MRFRDPTSRAIWEVTPGRVCGHSDSGARDAPVRSAQVEARVEVPEGLPAGLYSGSLVLRYPGYFRIPVNFSVVNVVVEPDTIRLSETGSFEQWAYRLTANPMRDVLVQFQTNESVATLSTGSGNVTIAPAVATARQFREVYPSTVFNGFVTGPLETELRVCPGRGARVRHLPSPCA